jgi:hypothetical protein
MKFDEACVGVRARSLGCEKSTNFAGIPFVSSLTFSKYVIKNQYGIFLMCKITTFFRINISNSFLLFNSDLLVYALSANGE